MIELGVLKLSGATSVLTARAKVMRLGEALRLDPITATRLATATSQTARQLAVNGREPRIRIHLEDEAVSKELRLSFEGWRTRPEVDALQTFFNTTHISNGGGGYTLLGTVRLGAAELHFDDDFITAQQERLRQRSRNELMHDIAEQNRELARHRYELEDIVLERTAELKRVTESAEQANRAKSQFLSNMSHELRTPLNGVLGYTQVLQRDPNLTPEQRESLAAIENCGRHLLTLINDVLDLSKIEAGKLDLDYAPCDVRMLVRAVFDIVRPKAEDNGLRFSADVADNVPRGVSTDETKLTQILVNLLGNAVKFTSHGSVGLHVRTTDGYLELTVSDTGIGMTDQETAAIFDPFAQAEGGKVSGGTGLGLAISKRIVEALGGSIRVESVKHGGSRFSIVVPLVEADIDTLADRKQVSLSDNRDVMLAPGQDITLLVADDNEANRDILVRLLRHAGFKTIEAVNGKEAVDKLRAHDIPLALMDIRMPSMSGAEATVVIRNDERLRDMKVVAVSASVFADDRPDSVDSLFDDFIPKPIRASDVFRAIDKHLGVTFMETAVGIATVAPGMESVAFDIRAVDATLAGTTAEKLRGSVEMGDIAAASAIAAEVEGQEPALAEELGRLGRAFDLTGLESLANDLRDRSRSS